MIPDSMIIFHNKIQTKKRELSCISILFLVLVFACNSATKESSKVTIAASANMQYALGPVTEKFTVKTGIPCELIIGSSGKHTAQIMEGAPFDIFLSADMKYPTELYKKGFTTAAPEIYASGKLVLWTMVDGLPVSIENLNDISISHIALANPKTAPYGQAAIEVLKKYGLLDSLKNKLVYGESIGQTNQFIYSKSAEIGFTAQSVVLAPEMKGKGKWVLVNDTDYKPISQGAVIIKQSEGDWKQANKFYNFLFSNEAKIILKDFGYSVDE